MKIKATGKSDRRIQAVIFDWGGVVIDNPADALLDYFARYFGVDRTRMLSFYAPHEHDFQTGRLTEQGLWERAEKTFGVAVPADRDLWKEAVRDLFTDKPETIALVRELSSKGLRTALLTNTEVPTREFYFEKEYPFDVAFFSCDEGIAKPACGIFRNALAKLCIDANEAAFIDDKEENVDAAKAIGMRGIHYAGIAAVRDALADVLA
jgi:putative hydrolase of the HAD superfamily